MVRLGYEGIGGLTVLRELLALIPYTSQDNQ